MPRSTSAVFGNAASASLLGVGGGLFLGHPNFSLASTAVHSNTAFLGGGLFLATELSGLEQALANARLMGNRAAGMGHAAFWYAPFDLPATGVAVQSVGAVRRRLGQCSTTTIRSAPFLCIQLYCPPVSPAGCGASRRLPPLPAREAAWTPARQGLWQRKPWPCSWVSCRRPEDPVLGIFAVADSWFPSTLPVWPMQTRTHMRVMYMSWKKPTTLPLIGASARLIVLLCCCPCLHTQ